MSKSEGPPPDEAPATAEEEALAEALRHALDGVDQGEASEPEVAQLLEYGSLARLVEGGFEAKARVRGDVLQFAAERQRRTRPQSRARSGRRLAWPRWAWPSLAALALAGLTLPLVLSESSETPILESKTRGAPPVARADQVSLLSAQARVLSLPRTAAERTEAEQELEEKLRTYRHKLLARLESP